MSLKVPPLHKLASYALVGTAVAAIYFALYYAFFNYLALPRLVANSAAYAMAVTAQYFMQTAFTFRDSAPTKARPKKFILTVAMGFAFSTVVMNYLVPKGVVPEVVGLILVVAVLPFTNLLLMFFWVFVGPRPSPIEKVKK